MLQAQVWGRDPEAKWPEQKKPHAGRWVSGVEEDRQPEGGSHHPTGDVHSGLLGPRKTNHWKQRRSVVATGLMVNLAGKDQAQG